MNEKNILLYVAYKGKNDCQPFARFNNIIIRLG